MEVLQRCSLVFLRFSFGFLDFHMCSLNVRWLPLGFHLFCKAFHWCCLGFIGVPSSGGPSSIMIRERGCQTQGIIMRLLLRCSFDFPRCSCVLLGFHGLPWAFLCVSLGFRWLPLAFHWVCKRFPFVLLRFPLVFLLPVARSHNISEGLSK